MKAFIALVAVLCILLPVQPSFSRGNHRGAIDRKWKEVEAWQQRQNERFKKIEQDAEKSFRKMQGDEEDVERFLQRRIRTCP